MRFWLVSPVSLSTAATSSTNPASRSWRTATLTLIASNASSPNSARQRDSWAHASRSTHAPSGTISPERSATGMKSAGETKPRSGCCQRTSASAPASRPVCRSKTGW